MTSEEKDNKNTKAGKKSYTRQFVIAGVLTCMVITLTVILSSCLDLTDSCSLSEAQKQSTDSIKKLGDKHYAAGRLDSAIYYCYIIATRYDNDKATQEERMASAYAYNNCGICYFMLGNYPRAYNSFNNATRLGDENIKMMVNNNIASIYNYFNDKEKALDYLHKAFNGALKTKNRDVLYSSALNIMNYNFGMDTISDNNEIYAKIKQAKTPQNDFAHYVETTAEGMRFYEQGQVPQAIAKFKDAVEISDKLLEPLRYRTSSYSNIVQTFLNEQQPDSAIAYVDKMLEIALKIEQTESIMNGYDLLAHCYKEKGNRELELEYRLKYLNIRDSLFSTKEYGKILDFQSAYDLDNIERKLVESEYARTIRDIVIWFSVTFLIIALILIIWIFMQNRRLRQTLASLYEKAKTAAESSLSENKLSIDAEINISTPITPHEDQDIVQEGTEELKSPMLDTERAGELKVKIEEVMKNGRPWLSSEFSLLELSRSVGSNPKYVSYVLNRLLGKTFSEYVNEFRVREACRRLSDGVNSHMTIESIGKSVGFKSRSNFGPAFKKVTGLSPKDYLAMAKNEQKIKL